MFALPTRTLLRSAVLIGAAAIGINSASAAGTPVTVVLGYIANVESFGPFYAREKGYFAAEGLDVTIVPGGTGIDQVQMVSSGVATIGISNPEAILPAVDKGEKFKVFASEFQTSPLAVTCRKDSGITTPAQMKGKKLGVKQNADIYAAQFLKKNGLTMDDVERTTIGGSDISLIIAGRIDCMITSFAFNEPRLIEQAGVPVNVIRVGDFGLNSQVDSYFVKADWFADPANQATLVKYLRAEGKAWDAFFKDPEGMAKWFIDGAFNDGLNIEQQSYQAKTQVTFMSDALTKEKGILWVNPKTWAETAANSVESGASKTIPNFDELLTTAILEKAGLPKH